MLGAAGVVSSGKQREFAHSLILVAAVRIAVARHQRVVLVQLIINARRKRSIPLWGDHALAERNLVEVVVQNGSADDGILVELTALEVQEKRALLGDDRSTDASTVAS